MQPPISILDVLIVSCGHPLYRIFFSESIIPKYITELACTPRKFYLECRLSTEQT